MASNNLCFPLDELRGRDNFDAWKRHAKSYLVLKGCWKMVSEDLVANATGNDIHKDELALAENTLMIEPTNFAHITAAKNAKEAWDALLIAFEDTGLTRKVELLKRLVQTNLSDFCGVQEYVSQIIMMSQKAQQTGLKLDDELVASLMLAGLPEEFATLVIAVENLKATLNVDVVKNLLLQDAKFDCSNADEKVLVSNKRQYGNANTYIGHHKKLSTKKKNPQKRNPLSAYLLSSFSLLTVRDNNIQEWYIDSGATSHMTNTKSILHNLKNVSDKHVVVANNKKMVIKCTGDVSVVLNPRRKKKTNFLRDVEYVPDMAVNLLSVRPMALKGNKVVFKNDTCKIFNQNGELLATARSFRNLYKLHCVVDVNNNDKALMALDEIKLWHGLLGHICDNNFKNFLNASIVLHGVDQIL